MIHQPVIVVVWSHWPEIVVLSRVACGQHDLRSDPGRIWIFGNPLVNGLCSRFGDVSRGVASNAVNDFQEVFS